MRAGQYTLIEQTMLFGAGVAIALGFLFVFEDLGGDVQSGTADIQTRLVSQYVASSAVELVESGADGKILVPVPGSIAQQGYVLRLSEDGAAVATTGSRHTAALHGLLSRLDADGTLESGPPSVAVKRDNNQLSLEAE